MTFYSYGSMSEEHVITAKMIQEGRMFCKKYYCSSSTTSNVADVTSFKLTSKGIMELYNSSNSNESLAKMLYLEEFIQDYKRLVDISINGAMRFFCF